MRALIDESPFASAVFFSVGCVCVCFFLVYVGTLAAIAAAGTVTCHYDFPWPGFFFVWFGLVWFGLVCAGDCCYYCAAVTAVVANFSCDSRLGETQV